MDSQRQMKKSTLSTHGVGRRHSPAVSFPRVSTRSSLIRPLAINQMAMIAFRVSLTHQIMYDICQLFSIGSRVAQVRAIFQLPKLADPHLQSLQSKHLAYIEWFSPFQILSEPHHGLYKVTRDPMPEHREHAVVEVSAIRQSVQLFPCFNGSWRVNWTSDNVLEKCDTFFVDSFQN